MQDDFVNGLLAGRGSVGLQMRGIDHEALGCPVLLCYLVEDLIEDPSPAPAHEAVVQRLVRTIGRWRIFPLQAVLDDTDVPLITRLSSTRGMPYETGKYGLILFNCC